MIQAIRSTGNVLAVRRVVDMSEKISVLEPDSAPLTQLTKKWARKLPSIQTSNGWKRNPSLEPPLQPQPTPQV